MLQSIRERTLMQITNALFASSRRMKELSEPPTERDQVCTQLNLLREHCDPSRWRIHPVAYRSGEALKELSKSIYKRFKQQPSDKDLMTVEITRGELARNGKLASCWF